MRRINKKWNVSVIAICIWLIISTIGFFSLFKWILFNKNVDNQQLSSNSQLDIIKKDIDQKNGYWDLTNIANSVNLSEWKEVNVFIPKDKINDNDKVLLNFNNTWSVLALKVEKTTSDEFRTNPIYDLNWGFIIKDTSFWTTSEQKDKEQYQSTLIKNNDLKTLSSFLKENINKIGKVWSYILFDLGDKKLINSFNINLTSKVSSQNRDRPEVIWLTLDNGIAYDYIVNDTTNRQEFLFNETQTRYIKLDVIKTTNSMVNTINAWVNNNIGRELLLNEITLNKTSDKLNINISAISEITWVTFFNIYFNNNNKPVTSKLKNDTNFDVNINSLTNITKVWIELCSDINKCNSIVYKNL